MASLAACLAVGTAPAVAQTTFGALSNFDVFNDTGQECHGFEIELDGVSSADISYTFGSSYERYGNPAVVDFPGGVYVRYESPYDPSITCSPQATPLAPAVITPTDGHACWTGGSGNYLTAGCEHFGVGLTGNPTNTVYRWLVADPVTPGNLQTVGTKVSIPAPTWNVLPNPVPQTRSPSSRRSSGRNRRRSARSSVTRKWVKVFVTESPDPVELHHLVTDDPVVPDGAEPAEIETEWVLLAGGPGSRERADQ